MSAGAPAVAGVNRTLWPMPSEPGAKFHRTVSPRVTVANAGLNASPMVKTSTVLFLGAEGPEGESEPQAVRTTTRTNDSTRIEGLTQ